MHAKMYGLYDLSIPTVTGTDSHRTEVITNGLPPYIDTAVDFATSGKSALSSAPTAAWLAKERTYPELCRSACCRFVVLAIEMWPRWSRGRRLLRPFSARVPALLRNNSAVQALLAGWLALLTHMALQPFATSLLLQDSPALSHSRGAEPWFSWPPRGFDLRPSLPLHISGVQNLNWLDLQAETSDTYIDLSRCLEFSKSFVPVGPTRRACAMRTTTLVV